MKNYQTPRTLAECSFVTGYRRAERQSRIGEIVYGVVCIVCFAAIGVMLAWRG